MDPKEARQWLKSIIKQRLYIEQHKIGHRNSAQMFSICERLTRQLEAYPYKGAKILSFIRYHYSDIITIIPGNDSESTNLKKLNAICVEVWKTELLRSTTLQPLEKQSALFLPW